MGKTGVLVSGFRHDTGLHPESADRLRAISEVLSLPDLEPHLYRLEPRAAKIEELSLIHTKAYILQVQEACQGGIRALDPDTIICTESFDEACLAAGSLLNALDAIMAGEVTHAFCAVRPPGHHAEIDRAMGFCLFNNIAVAARYAQERHDLEKILIVDWDVHHGNGTQNVFYEDPDIFYFSIHQHPHYPGSGAREQTGKGAGEGTTLNIPLPGGCGDKEYTQAFEEVLIPKAKAFKPDLILISAGFDAHQDDPLAGMGVTEQGFGKLTSLVVDFAHEHCQSRVLSALEGGYNLSALQKAVQSHLWALIG